MNYVVSSLAVHLLIAYLEDNMKMFWFWPVQLFGFDYFANPCPPRQVQLLNFSCDFISMAHLLLWTLQVSSAACMILLRIKGIVNCFSHVKPCATAVCFMIVMSCIFCLFLPLEDLGSIRSFLVYDSNLWHERQYDTWKSDESERTCMECMWVISNNKE